jgi:hypothetical protein
MNRKNFEGCLGAEYFPRRIVRAGTHGIHVFLRHLVKIGSLGEISAEQPIRILTRASLVGFEIEFRAYSAIPPQYVTVAADTVPHAVCLAFLRCPRARQAGLGQIYYLFDGQTIEVHGVIPVGSDQAPSS